MSKRDRQKRLARKRQMDDAAEMPALAEIPKRQPNGQRRDRADSPQDERKPALQARARIFGTSDSRQGRRDMEAPHMGSDIGRVMQHEISGRRASDEIARLWQTFHAWCAAETSYRRRYLGQGEHPKGASIAMVPERAETDTGHSVDLRDPEQKDRDAVNGWMRWQGYLGHLTAGQRAALQDARLERTGLWHEQKPTSRGLAALSALKALHVVVAGG